MLPSTSCSSWSYAFCQAPSAKMTGQVTRGRWHRHDAFWRCPWVRHSSLQIGVRLYELQNIIKSNLVSDCADLIVFPQMSQYQDHLKRSFRKLIEGSAYLILVVFSLLLTVYFLCLPLRQQRSPRFRCRRPNRPMTRIRPN